jgi:TonB family protein
LLPGCKQGIAFLDGEQPAAYNSAKLRSVAKLHPATRKGMSDTQGYSESTLPIPDRRAHLRRRPLPLAYVDLGENNGGIVLNISAGGLAIAAVEVLHEEHLPRMRFQLPQSNVRVEATGQIAWTGESKKEAGVRFVDLSEEAAAQINNWLSSEASESEPPPLREDVHTSARHPFSALMAAAPVAPTHEPAMPRPAAERQIEDWIPGRSFTAALQKTKAPIGTPPPVQSLAVAEEPKTAQAGQIFSAGMDLGASQRRWWALTALISLFAVISFVAGMAAGGGGWDGVLRLLGRKSTLAGEPAQVAEAAGRSALEGAPASAADGAPKPGTDSSSAKSQDPKAASRNAAPNHSSGASTPVAPTGRASQKDSSDLLLKLPETPVSASASVAITSRRSIQVAPESAAQTTQQGQNVQIGQLFYRVEPFYPPDAERQGIEGTVEVHASVGRDGRIRSVQASSGPPQLTEAAVNAVREWRYKPTLLNGQPIESDVDVKMTFRLPPR